MIAYFLESGMSLLILYAFYYVFLKKGTNFQQARLFLLSAMILSILVPLFEFSFVQIDRTTSQESVFLKTITVGATNIRNIVEQDDTNNMLMSILRIIYFTGISFFSVRFIIQLSVIIGHIVKYGVENQGDVKIINTNQNQTSFSFLGYIFVNKTAVSAEKLHKILAHERVHSRQYHSIDLLITEIIAIFLWFNPFIWFYKKSLKETHEYLADDGVMEQGCDITGYQLLLLEQVIGIQPGLANNFNKSLTIKRLSMMKTKKSSQLSKYRILLALPVIALMIAGFACCESENNDMNTDKDGKMSKSLSEKIDNEPIFQIVEVMPEFPGGEQALRKFIAQNVKYPAKARKNGISGKVYVKFVVTKTGKVDHVSIARGIDTEEIKHVTVVGYKEGSNDAIETSAKLLEEEAMRVVSSLPDWKPGKQRNKPVNVYFTIPINFALQ